MIRVLFYNTKIIMTKYLTKIIPLLLLFLSFETFAAPATNKQIDQIIEIENWRNLKSELLLHGLPKIKDMTEANMVNQFRVPRPISADQQIFFLELSDIFINDMIEQIDEKQLFKNLHQAYQSLSVEQIDSLIEMYSHPQMRQAGKKSPLVVAKSLDQSVDIMNHLIGLDEIKKIAKESQKR